jgi:hypothetical protein
MNIHTSNLHYFCTACGYIFCDTCTTHRIIVPALDTKTPERVCDNCYTKLHSQTLASVFQNDNQYTQRTTMTNFETGNSSTRKYFSLSHSTVN